MSVFKLSDPENKGKCRKSELLLGFNKLIPVIADDILDFVLPKELIQKEEFSSLFNKV